MGLACLLRPTGELLWTSKACLSCQWLREKRCSQWQKWRLSGGAVQELSWFREWLGRVILEGSGPTDEREERLEGQGLVCAAEEFELHYGGRLCGQPTMV
ncbi:hypothetical protein P7K49_029186 [Saguinus oedipus]|uniref:Uncharacterized protein n=1 Tax=Saguinus oedipus TaxID=9490 RepID=A0ABQ9U6G7_SAGOE|nr:hypothetical protein P7K49_029186 [Saguinus oedipus]